MWWRSHSLKWELDNALEGPIKVHFLSQSISRQLLLAAWLTFTIKNMIKHEYAMNNSIFVIWIVRTKTIES